MPDGPIVLRRSITALQDASGRLLARANVWTAKGYSTRTFHTAAEANAWVPNA